MQLEFFGDDPVDGSTIPDRLDRSSFAEHLTTLLERVHEQSASSVLALIGSSGAGKSSLLEITMRLLRTSDWRVAEFNPWAYSDLTSMLPGFFAEIAAALPEQDRPAKTLGEPVTGDGGPAARRRQLADALHKTKRPVLVVLDDLDRLAPDALLLVLKLVRLVGRLPGVYYLLAYDERTLLDVLGRTDLCGGDDLRARDYLEKVVQVRLDLPPLRRAQAVLFLVDGLGELARSQGVQLTDDGRSRFQRAYERHLEERLTTPRVINRYLAQVDAHYTMLGEEVDFVDFALLTFVRTFEPRLYAAIVRTKGALAVSQARPAGYLDDTDNMEDWRRLVASAGVSEEHVDGMLDVLAELFLPVQAARTGDGGYRQAAVEAVAARKGVGHRDYFDRYVGFMVPGDDLPDAAVRRLLTELAEGRAGREELERLSLRLRLDTARTVRKIALRRPRDKAVTDALVTFLASNFAQLRDEQADGEQRRVVQWLVADLLAEDPDEATARLVRIAESPGGLLLAARMLGRSSVPRTEEAVTTISARIADTCDAHANDSFLAAPYDVRELLWVWRSVDADRARDWLRAATRASRWSLLDIAGWLVERHSSGDEVALDAVDDTIESVLGTDYVLKHLQRELDGHAAGELGDLADTSEGRVIRVLRLLRDRRTAGTRSRQ
jgi:type II secretory pathway predicted ATPase ExeA